VGPESYVIPANARGRIKATKTLHAAVLETVKAAEPDHHAEVAKRFSISQNELAVLTSKISKGLSENQTSCCWGA